MITLRSALIALAAITGSLVCVASADASAVGNRTFSNHAEMSQPYGVNGGFSNEPMEVSLRDDNGNMLVVDGRPMAASSYATGSSGVGAGNVVSAVGNQINVVVEGNYNTVVVDAVQINNGNQTASMDLNGSLNF